jgi:N utilization substance protein B
VTDPSLAPGRHVARERVIGLLYESEIREFGADELLDQLPLTPAPYAIEALRGIEATRAVIDVLIDEHASGWTIDRLPSVDRAILRLAIWELIARPDIPVAVIIDEAVELAKEYSTERSSSFVNGVLDAVAAHVRDQTEGSTL